MTDAPTQAATVAPQVWCVDTRNSADYENPFALDRVFTTEDTANTYAAQIVAPFRARVYPMAVLDDAPTLLTNYAHEVSLPIDPDNPDWAWLRSAYGAGCDPDTRFPEVCQFTEDEMGTSHTLVPVTSTTERLDEHGCYTIKVRGTDKDAVREALVAAYHQIRPPAAPDAEEQA